MCLSWVHTIILFFAIATASVISPPSTCFPGAKDITTFTGTTGKDHVSIQFRAPCDGCFEDFGDGLDLTLEIDVADEECSGRHPRLNGLRLAPSSNENGVATGQQLLYSRSSSGSPQAGIFATWESTCLKNEASMLSVRIHSVTENGPAVYHSGFTTSFKQKGKPTVLNLQDKPVDRVIQHRCDGWLISSTGDVLPISSEPDSSVDEALEVEYAKLAFLQRDLEELHENIHSSLHTIMSLLKKKFTSCSSMRCIWSTAMNEVTPISQLIAAHFSHHKTLVSGCRQGATQSPCLDIFRDGSDDAQSVMNEELDVFPEQISALPSSAISNLPSTSAQPTTRAVPTTTASSLPTSISNSLLPDTTLSPTLPYRQPDEPREELQHRLHLAIMLCVLLVIATGVITRWIVRYRDPRRRAERAARREERNTRRLYRKAACQHKLRTWWKNVLTFRKQGPEDYEEKRQMILEQEGPIDIDDGGIQKQIRTMQNASNFVRDLVEAEEGRARRGLDLGGLEVAEIDGRSVRSGQSSSDIAPSYKTDVTPPPGYAVSIDGQIVVINGFGYTPSTSTADDVTESSIVDCSPRMSMETGRSTILTKDTRDQ